MLMISARPACLPWSTGSRGRKTAVATSHWLQSCQGVYVLIDPLAMLGAITRLELVLYGNPNDCPFYAKQLRHWADPMPQVRWGGVFGSEQVFAVLAQLDLLVVPSLWRENAPLIVLQSLASSLPLLLSDVEGMAEQVQPGTNALLLPPGNSCALAGLIQQLGEDPQRLAALVNQGGSPRTITDYSDHLEQIYAQLVRG